MWNSQTYHVISVFFNCQKKLVCFFSRFFHHGISTAQWFRGVPSWPGNLAEFVGLFVVIFVGHSLAKTPNFNVSFGIRLPIVVF
jgi:hypothetical protein